MFSRGSLDRMVLCCTLAAVSCGGEFKGPDSRPVDALGEGLAFTDAVRELRVDQNLKPPPNPYDPKNPEKDYDCDGLSDHDEYQVVYVGGKKTDPKNPDTDGDGILDGVEAGRTSSVDPTCVFVGDADPKTGTSATGTDSDADLLPDGLEDANHNGKVDPGETDPMSSDSDGDGLPDSLEDKNRNGKVDPGETDPRKKDSDGDTINDGVEVSITKTDPLKPDSDGDTCPDGQEDSNQDGKVDPGETDPHDPKDCNVAAKDSDGDKVPDDKEDTNGNGVYEPQLGETDPKNPDTDGDGLLDGVEDQNHDGKVGLGETDPRRKDTDCDGLQDGPDQGALLGEDQNKNGVVDPGETSPTKLDSDGDGLQDGVERKATVNPDPVHCPGLALDADPATGTDATKPDSDGDGVADGSEDANQNGKLDPGELDPNDPADGVGTVAQVCAGSKLVPILFKEEGQPDLRLALPPSFSELATIKPAGGPAKGIMGFDPTSNVAFLVYRQAAATGATTPTADEAALRPALQAAGALQNVTTQTFTTWDGYPALQATYEQAGSVDLKTRANALANALVGGGAGVLVGAGGGAGPFKLQAELVHRSDKSVVVLIALTPLAAFVEPGIFKVGDLAGGSALAQFGDAASVQCEKFVPGFAKIDFIFVVDNSYSMADHQLALANTGNALAASLNNSSVDWRVAMVTTSYPYSYGTGGNVLRGFTRSIDVFKGWLTQGNVCVGGFCSLSGGKVPCTSNDQCWVDTTGDSTERCLEAAAKAVSVLSPASAVELPGKARSGAKVVVIILGDADDQSSFSVAQYASFFQTPSALVGSYQNLLTDKVVVHGIVCPAGQLCNEFQWYPQHHGEVISATGGVRGDISTPSSITATMQQIVQSSIGAAGYKLLKPPIGASLKVALAAVKEPALCTKDNLPRSRVDGFDFDGPAQTLTFFGGCRPASLGTEAAVSYRYWIDLSKNPDGSPMPCASDPYFDPTDPDFCKGKLGCNKVIDVCECPADCGALPPPGKICNTNKQVCDYICTHDCNGICGSLQICDPASCTCKCSPNATCAPGYLLSPVSCSCVCDTAALGCGPTYEADPVSCSCRCKPDCGGCGKNEKCVISKCACESIG
jgi:hypothetical protein